MSKASNQDRIRKRLELSKKERLIKKLERLIKKLEPERTDAYVKSKAKSLIHIPSSNDVVPSKELELLKKLRFCGKSRDLRALGSLL